ncbi:MAG: hypothetical protein A2Y33_12400 [Spirochaetes bacterium GWF1_51_8]|nr:MAG: hypothetical protein A2Y33_12400 [Spirochaetes bacterium GWF1_51_8]
MLRNTFCHIKGVGKVRERQIWDAGILSWDDVLDDAKYHRLLKKADGAIGPELAETIEKAVVHSVSRLESGDLTYFFKRLPPQEHWRAFREFRDAAAYFDIETDGLSPETGHITTIALYDGRAINSYIYGGNLHEFPGDIAGYKLIVTYNGKGFDVPFCNRYFGVKIGLPHIDLCHVMHSLGYYGGLKGTEKALGLSRGGLDGVDGYFAVLLWNEYENTDNIRALETLIAYNIEDSVNLEHLMITAYNLKLKQFPKFSHYEMKFPARPESNYKPDPLLIEKLKKRHPGFTGKSSI